MADILFIHVPRTGGTSVKGALDGVENVDIKGHRLRYEGYKHPSELKDSYSYIFSFLRNPYSRTVSSYFYLKEGGTNEDDNDEAEKLVKPYNSFEDFVLNGLEKAIEENQIHFLPQSFWITDKNQNNITDFVGKTENIINGLGFLSEELNLEFNWLRSHSNGSDHRNWNFYYDKFSIIEKVRSVYLQDILLFNML